MTSLTAEILDRFEEASTELRAIAADIGRGESPGFEELLGALRRYLSHDPQPSGTQERRRLVTEV